MKFEFNFNTLVGSLCLMGVVWLVKTTNSTERTVALMQQTQTRQETDTLDLRARVLLLEQHSRDQDLAIEKLRKEVR